jgi:hypothetical protein
MAAAVARRSTRSCSATVGRGEGRLSIPQRRRGEPGPGPMDDRTRAATYDDLFRVVTLLEEEGVEYTVIGGERCPPRYFAAVASTLSCVFVSKSLASCRSRSCSFGSPMPRLTMRPRFTAGRAAISFVQRTTFV